MSNQTTTKLPTVRFENLNALRFFAAFSVVVFHFFRDIKALFPDLQYSAKFDVISTIADKGSLGVNFFFVLSGFLITYLILHEAKHRGFFHYGKFMIRRTLRIWPLYFLMIIIGFVIFPLVFDGFGTVHKPVNYVLFLANFDEIWYGAADPNNFLTSAWSIAVEEQFYLFWGLAMIILVKMKKLPVELLLLILLIGSFVFRWYYLGNHRVIYFHTFSVCQDLLTGCFIGVSLFKGRSWLDRLKTIPMWMTIGIYLLGFAVCVAKNKLFIGELEIFERFALSIFFAFIILDQIRGEHSFFKFGRIKLFEYFGKISYGIYMFHLVVMYIAVVWITDSGWTGYWLIPFYFLIAIGGTILVSMISYRFLEKPLLKLKPH